MEENLIKEHADGIQQLRYTYFITGTYVQKRNENLYSPYNCSITEKEQC